MYSYILLGSSLVLLVVFISFRESKMTPKTCEASPRPLADEEVTVSTSLSVPGDSPAYYTGDPSNDVLVVSALDLKPNPPKE